MIIKKKSAFAGFIEFDGQKLFSLFVVFFNII